LTPARLTLTVWDPDALTKVIDTLSPGWCERIAVKRVSDDVIETPPSLVITEPRVMPEPAAGVPD
jgi:hypothetical protein